MRSKSDGKPLLMWLQTPGRASSKWRVFTATALFLVLFYNLVHVSLGDRSPRILSTAGTSHTDDADGLEIDKNGFVLAESARDYCAQRRWEPYTPRDRPRKVYDMLMVSTELDWLELHLEELSSTVDYFIVVEAATNFHKERKPLHVQDNLFKFRKWHPKLIHRVIDMSYVNITTNKTWEQENYLRDAMYDSVLLSLTDEKAPQQGDVLIVSDADELPRPSTITALRNCQFPARTTLRSDFFYYSFQWRHRGIQWEHPQATFYNGRNDTIHPNELRGGIWSKPYFNVYNAAWSCSSCFATIKEMRTKITSFSHVEYNLPKFKTQQWMIDCVRFGKDLFERENERYDRVVGNVDLPLFLRTKKGARKFDYMLNRDPVNGNFRDVDVGSVVNNGTEASVDEGNGTHEPVAP